MGLPEFSEARRYYRAALQRQEDAKFLREAERTTAAVYLGGYAVECVFKALILSGIAQEEKRIEVTASFQGGKAHDFGWLRKVYFDNLGSSMS